METRQLWLMILGAVWVITWAGSFVAFFATGIEGEGFTRGWNRITTFLGWQGVAAMAALALWGVGRGWPKGHAVRKASTLPLALALVLALGVAAIALVLSLKE